jgi:O-antigen ligase
VINSTQNEKSRLKGAGMAFFWLSAFYLVYCARPEDWISGMGFVPLAKITSVGAVLAFLFGSARGRRKFRELPVEAHLLLAMIGILFLSSMLSPVWKGGAISRTMDFAKVWVIWILTFLLVTDLAKFRRIVFIQAASVPLISVLSMVKGRHTVRLEGVLGGIYSNSNDLAFAIALSFPLCLMFFLNADSRFRKVLWAAAMVAMGAALMMTASRGGLITFLCTAVICLWHFGVRGKRFYLIAATGVAGIVLLVVAGGPMMDRLSTLWGGNKGRHPLEEMRAEASLEQRQFVIDKAIEGIEHYPILGIGTRNFEIYSTVWLEVHMTYLQIAVEGGIPCLILFLVFFARGFLNIRSLRKRKNLTPELKLFVGALHSVLVGFIVGALFSPEAYQFFPFFAVAYTSALLAYVRGNDRAAVASSIPRVERPVGQLSPTFVNRGRVLVNP